MLSRYCCCKKGSGPEEMPRAEWEQKQKED